MAWLSTASFNPFSSLVGPYVAASPLSSSASPDWVLLDKTARISAFRNATTAVCDTGEGQAVEATFWLVDPPGVSYLSVHCPGHGEDDFSGEPVVVCAEAAFVLFRVSLSVSRRGQEDSTYHFIYAARGAAGKPSLHLLPPPPDPDAQLGLLPCDGDHYAVAFLDRKWTARDQAWQFHAYVFSTKTQAWRKKPAASSEPGRPLLRTSKQITVGATSLGWVDISHGITLLCDVLDECPVIKYIPFPAPLPLPSKALVPAECLRDAPFPVPLPSKALVPAECLRDVSCCDDLIKFVQVEFDEPGCRMKGKRWTATTWTRKISGNNWRICTRVDVADISVDPRYSAVLPELWDDVNQELELKKLLFLGPILAVGNSDRLYMMAKVDEKDSKDWVVAVDMKSAAVEGLATVSTQRYSPTTLFSPCAFPSYLNKTTPGNKWEDPSGGSDGGILEEEEKSQARNRMGGPDMGNPVDKYFKRISASQCVLQVLLTQRWLRQLDKWLDSQGSTCIECRRLLRFSCPASALRFDIHFVVKYASYNGQGKSASKCVDFCLRALDDFDELLWESPLRDPSTAEAMKSQIGVLLGVLDHILEFVPLRDMPRRVQTVLAGVCLKQEERVLVFGHCDKPCHAKGRSDEQKQSGRSNPSNSGEAQKKKKKNKKKKQQQQQVLVLDRRLPVQLYLLYFVGSVLVVVAVKALCRHLGSV
ncbi:hypothetical protein ACQ4PT_001450 [Festuca glaucescens]